MSVSDASLPLQKAIVHELRTADIVADRVYDFVPEKPNFPYFSIGSIDVLTEEADEYEGSDTSIQIDGWSRTASSEEIKRMGRLARAALHGAYLTLDEDQRLVSMTVERVRYTVDPDGLTKHAIIAVRARTEPSA